MSNKILNYFYWKSHAVYGIYSKRRLFSMVEGIEEILDEYSKQTKSTGTKFPTLYYAVKLIQKYKPKMLLESGTGTSTIVLAETLMQLKKSDPSYNPKLISMESVPEWHDMAVKLLPEKYKDIVEIRLGEREKFEYAMFRGYCHSNIPLKNYDFVFLDGPSYNDDKGSSSCLDALKVRLNSNVKKIIGVVDTRVSSVFVMQNIFGLNSIRYSNLKRTCSFSLNKIESCPKINSKSFNYLPLGKVKLNEKKLLWVEDLEQL